MRRSQIIILLCFIFCIVGTVVFLDFENKVHGFVISPIFEIYDGDVQDFDDIFDNDSENFALVGNGSILDFEYFFGEQVLLNVNPRSGYYSVNCFGEGDYINFVNISEESNLTYDVPVDCQENLKLKIFYFSSFVEDDSDDFIADDVSNDTETNDTETNSTEINDTESNETFETFEDEINESFENNSEDDFNFSAGNIITGDAVLGVDGEIYEIVVYGDAGGEEFGAEDDEFGAKGDDFLNVTLSSPENASSSAASWRHLNLSYTHSIGENGTVNLYGCDDSNSFNTNLLYVWEDVENGTDLSYKWDAPIIEPDSSTVVLFHLDNRSEFGEDSSTFYDFSGNGNNGSCTTCPTFNSSGKFAGACQFDGSTQFINISNSSSLYFNKSHGTYAVWIYPHTISGNDNLFEDSNEEIEFSLSDGTIFFYPWQDPTWNNYIITTDTVSTSQWTHVAVTWNYTSKVAIIYINGDKNTEGNLSSTWTQVADAGDFMIGRDYSHGSRFFDGMKDEIAMYNRTLSSSEIRDLYRLQSDTYYWKANVSEGNNANESAMWQFEILPDTIAPKINLISPVDNAINITDKTPNFVFNATDEAEPELSCVLWLNNSAGEIVAYGSDASVDSGVLTTITANQTLSNGNYYWWVNCSDGTNENKSEIRNLSIQVPIKYLTTPYIGIVNETSERIRLESDVLVNVTIEYGETLSYSLSISNSVFQKIHELELTGLTPNTTYYYRVNISDEIGFKNSTNSSFKTSNDSITHFKFGWISDTQGYGSCGGIYTDGLLTMTEKLSEAGVEFILGTGDLIEMGGCTSKEEYDEGWRKWHNYSSSSGEIPYIAALGNHDIVVTDQVTSWKAFADYWIHPLNGDGEEGYWNETTYAWRYGNALFISLDTMEATHDYNGNISGSQLDWFENTALKMPGYAHKIVFLHKTIRGSDRDGISLYDAEHSDYLDNLMYENGVTIQLAGHDHGLCLNATHDGEMPYMVLGGSSAGSCSGCVGTCIPDYSKNYGIIEIKDNVMNVSIYNLTGYMYYTYERTMDVTKPYVYLETPTNNTINTTDNTPDFVFNVSDEIGSNWDCFLYMNNGSTFGAGNNDSTLNATSTTITANSSLVNDTYFWWVNCSDGTNEDKSEVRNISIEVDEVSSSLPADEDSSDDSSGVGSSPISDSDVDLNQTEDNQADDNKTIHDLECIDLDDYNIDDILADFGDVPFCSSVNKSDEPNIIVKIRKDLDVPKIMISSPSGEPLVEIFDGRKLDVPFLNISFIDSNFNKSDLSHCYNSVLDFGEDDIDCGGFCGECIDKSYFMSWLDKVMYWIGY